MSFQSRNRPLTFTGLLGVCVGEKRRIHIPANLAYGKIGDGKNVPPGADLVYDVEVVSSFIEFNHYQLLGSNFQIASANS